MGRIRKSGFFDLDISDLTDEAVRFIKETITKDNYPVPVAFSGGKDSICTAKIMELSGIPYKLNYSFTGIDAPEVVRFIRKKYPNCQFLPPKETFWKYLEKDIPPTINRRWCCNLLKKNPAKQAQIGSSQLVLGVRAEESSKRSSYGRVATFNGKTRIHPIFDWKEWAVWEFIEKHELPYPLLYDLGFSRIGCIICPFHSYHQHMILKKRYPRYFALWEGKVKKLFTRRMLEGKTMRHLSAEDYLQEWYRNGMVKWYAGEERQKGWF